MNFTKENTPDKARTKCGENKLFLAETIVLLLVCLAGSFLLGKNLNSTDVSESSSDRITNETLNEAIPTTDDIVVENNIYEQSNIENRESNTDIEDDKFAESIVAENTYEESGVSEDTYVAPTVTDDMYGEFENQIDIYDSRALNKFLGDKHITINEISEAIDNNDNIDYQWKEIIKEFAQRITSEYHKLDMRLFYENVKRLVIEYDSLEVLNQKNFMAYYNYEDGVIHVRENADFSENSYELMITRHEIGHMISLGILENDTNKKIVCITSNGDYGKYLSEAIDVIISSGPYEQDYDFTDFGYGINANELEAVIYAIPDFDISVLANRDVYAIADYLEEINPNSVSASTFISLMDSQAIEYYSNSTDEEVKEYFGDIYRYIANTYVNYVLNEKMSREEIQKISEELKTNLCKNLSYGYEPAGIEEIDNVFDEYYNSPESLKPAQ